MSYQYDNRRYEPPAPVLPISVHIPGNSAKVVTTEALLDTGADITCLPKALIDAIGAERVSTYRVVCLGGMVLGPADSYFVEFEIGTKAKIVEVIGVDDKPSLGRNFINEFRLQLDGPGQKLDIS